MNVSDRFKINVGIDIGKDKHHVTILHEDRLFKQFFINNNSQGFSKLMAYIDNKQDNVQIAMEATAHYYVVIARWFDFYGYNLLICNPRQSKYLRNVLKPYFKTDIIDSMVIAKGAQLGVLKGELFEEKYIRLKELLQLRRKLSKDLTRVKNRIHRIVDVTFPERNEIFPNLFSKASLAVLKVAQSPRELKQIPVQQLATIIKTKSRGQLKATKTLELKQLASSTVGIQDAISTLQICLFIDQVELIQTQMKQMEEQIKIYVKDHFQNQVHLLLSLPGISIMSAATIIAYLGNIERFKGKRPGNKVLAYTGLAITQHSSGIKERYGKISKAGPSILRHYLWFAALNAIRDKSAFQQFYERLVNRGVVRGKAVIAVAAKLLRCAFSMLRDNTSYNPKLLYPRASFT